MSGLMLFNKPFDVLCQFTPVEGRQTLADHIDVPGYYAAGRLDRDSEGLMLLTNDGQLQHRISHPKHKLEKRYLVQVEGSAEAQQLQALRNRIDLKDGPARASYASLTEGPARLWPRQPPIRHRAHIPTSWIEIGLTEGRNRQVRRMTAAVGLPTLRLIRIAIGPVEVWDLPLGHYQLTDSHRLGLVVPPSRVNARHRPTRR